jgi:predicted ArsR family transcriptional regulator
MNATDYGKILAYCAEHGSITAREAFIELNINSPRKVISDLRKKGYIVKAEKMYNNGKTPYHRYYISKKEGDSDGSC